MIRKRIAILFLTVFCILAAAACSAKQEMKDGYYTAQAEEYSNGWKEFVTITVQRGRIISSEYNAINESGFIKSWDNTYMAEMKAIEGTYPNEYTRAYSAQLRENQSGGVDAISGASASARSFDILAEAVIEQAQKGDSKIVVMKTQ